MMPTDSEREEEKEETSPSKKTKRVPASYEGLPYKANVGAIENVGIFFFKSGSVHARQIQRLREISGFFNKAVVARLLTPVAKQQYSLSLRLLDYTMTNWAKKTRIMTEMNTSQGKIPWNLFSLYKDWLRFYRRRGFDPFRRRERIFFLSSSEEGGEDERLDTTVAQLNFLRWADKYGILDYVSQNKSEIEQDMMATLGDSKKRRQEAQREPRKNSGGEKKRKRAELSRAPSSKCVVYPIKQEISFEAVEETV